MECMLQIQQELTGIVHGSDQRQTFLELVDVHGASIMSMLRRLCQNAHDADDVFQETAVRVWRNLHTRPKLRNPRAWLMTIAYRTFLDHRSRRSAHLPLTDLADERRIDPHDHAEHLEQCRRLKAVVAELPEPIREVVTLHYKGGLTLRQTAKTMGISVGTVKSRLGRALERLRRVLL